MNKMQHYFAFDYGMFDAMSLYNIKPTMAKIQKYSDNPLFIDGIYENPTKQWEPRIDNGYPNVILDDKGIYHCYYTLFIVDKISSSTSPSQKSFTKYQASEDRQIGPAYACSKDGINWEKPNLGIVNFEGSKDNNLLLKNVVGTGVFFDIEESDPTKRFKLITRKEDTKKFAVAFSSDGIHFSPLEEWQENNPVIGRDCHNSIFKDSKTNEYVLSTRLWSNNLRVIAISKSKDFINWTPLKEIVRGQGYEEQIYSMPIFEYKNIYFDLASVYKQGDKSLADFDTLNLELYWSSDLNSWNKAVPQNNILLPRGKNIENWQKSDFDSATIFASPIMADKNRLYYTGSKGKHSSWRDTGL